MSAPAAVTSSTHKFPWQWKLSDLEQVPKNGLKVFSTFSCGGGSSMGYKLAGYEVLGNVEIDPKIAAIYKKNNHPKISYCMDIRDFNKLEDLPEALFDLDVLDGSPPCSVFSFMGKRQEGWGKEKVFREGQKKQRLDDLFPAFIKTVEKLRPRAYIAENVEGLVKGNARGYVREIVEGLHEIGYTVQIFLLDSAEMGVPQRRRRVFFVGHKKELEYPAISLKFCEPPILFGQIRTETGIPVTNAFLKDLISRRKPSDNKLLDVSKRERGRENLYSWRFEKDDKVALCNVAGSRGVRFYDGMYMSDLDVIRTQTFPEDYDFGDQDVAYVCGMSVPPVMMAQIASQVADQWLLRR